MMFGIRIEHLFFVSSLSVTVLSHIRNPVFSLQFSSSESSDIYNVTFGKKNFMRFYRCLISFKTCSVSYTERYTNPHGNNVLFISGSHPRTPQSEHPGISPLTWFCTRTGTGKLKCEHKHPADPNEGFGVRPLWECHGHVCPCIFFYKAGQISYDGSTAEECSVSSVDMTRSKRSRTKRASRSSSKSSSRSRSKPWSSSSGGGGRSSSGGGGGSSSGSGGSVDPETGKIIGITIGAIVSFCILCCLICYCVGACGDKKKEIANNDTAESPNNMAEERVADTWKKDQEFPLAGMKYDSENWTPNGEDGCVHSTQLNYRGTDNNDAIVEDGNGSERENAKGNGENWTTHELEHGNRFTG